MGTFFWLNCLAVSLFVTMWRSPRPDVRRRVDCFIQMINLWTSNYLQSQYSISADQNSCKPFKMVHFKLKPDRTSIEHRRPSINVRSLLPSTKCVTKETISPSANSESFRSKMRNTPTYFPILKMFNLVANCVHFHVKWRKARRFDARTVDSFLWNGIGEAHADPEWPEWFQK